MTASLIIPCWNVADTLPACLDCVRAQTLGDFEAIFVDDGSTDDTAAILASAAAEDPRICVITQKNRGVSAARNVGLDAARGDYIFFADPDDTFSSEMLARGVAGMVADGADYCVFAYRQRDAGGDDFHLVALKGDYRYRSNMEIRVGFMGRMFGYSPTQVRAWYAGTPLFAHREQGGVWRCVYRRALIEAHHVRFVRRARSHASAAVAASWRTSWRSCIGGRRSMRRRTAPWRKATAARACFRSWR